MLGPGVRFTAAQESLVTQQEIEAALRDSVREEESSRETIRTLLNREDVRRLAKASGIGVSLLDRAAAAVGSLEGRELEEAAAYAAQMNDELAGGDTIVISFSLVALLLIIILILVLTAD
jgi:phage FluMu protein gp41